MISNLYEAKNLFSLAKSYSLEASDRNHIGIQTDRGIEIVTLDCSAVSKSLYFRFIIETPKNFEIAKHLSSDRNEFLWSLDVKSVTELTTDPYATMILCSAGNPIIERFKFSPADKNTTYLAILTTFMSLTVYEDNAGKWTQVFDTTGEWLKHCTKNWIKAKTSTDWYQQLNQVKINTFCWQKFNQDLFLITAFENGDIAVFDKNSKLIQTFPTENKPPVDVHSIQLDHEIFITITYRTGQIFGIIFYPEDRKQIIKTIWEKEDLIEANPVHALKFNSHLYVIFSKLDEIHVIALNTNGWSKTVQIKKFDTFITSLSMGSEFIYATLSNSDVFKISPKNLNVTKIHAQEGFCPGGVCTTNGNFFVMATVANTGECSIAILIEPEFDAKLKIYQFLNKGGEIIECLDLLWLHKRNIIENELSDKYYEETSSAELQYWELTLCLTLLSQSDVNSQEIIIKKLENLGTSLLSKNTKICKSSNDLCPICEQSIVNDNLRIATCKNNHSVPRCCITLKPCSALNEASCVLCHSKISLKHVDNYQNTACKFCSGYFKKTIQTF